MGWSSLSLTVRLILTLAGTVTFWLLWSTLSVGSLEDCRGATTDSYHPLGPYIYRKSSPSAVGYGGGKLLDSVRRKTRSSLLLAKGGCRARAVRFGAKQQPPGDDGSILLPMA